MESVFPNREKRTSEYAPTLVICSVKGAGNADGNERNRRCDLVDMDKIVGGDYGLKSALNIYVGGFAIRFSLNGGNVSLIKSY